MNTHKTSALGAGALLLSALSVSAQQHEPNQAVAGLDVYQGLEAKLMASEPLLLSPSSVDVDHRGRVWVCEVMNYRRHNGKRPEGDRILILEDTDGDGVLDKQKVFYQGKDVDSAHGVCVLGNRVIISAGDDVFSLIDENGDDKSDRKEMLFTKIGGRQHDHGIHAFHFGPDGKLYFNFGNSGRQLCDKDGNVLTDLAGNEIKTNRKPYQQGMIFRCDLDGSNVESLGWNFRNNWEVAVDSYGRLWQSDNDDDGNRGVRINYVYPYGNYGYRDELTGAGWRDARPNIEKEIPLRHWHLNDPGVVPNLINTGAGSPTGIIVYEGDLLPKEFYGQPIHCDAGPNVVRAYPSTKKGAGFEATMLPILTGARNKWFRPSDVSVAPDGSLIVADWYDPGVGGHGMGDLDRGRIFMVAPKGHKYTVPKFDVSTPEKALQQLASPNEAVRYLAYQALKKQDGAPALLTKTFADSAQPIHVRARAFWAAASFSKNPSTFIYKAIADDNALLRGAGVRACRILDPQRNYDKLFAGLASDEDPQVRAAAAIALRFSDRPTGHAAWAALAATHKGEDRWFVEALGIGADLHWSDRFQAYLKATGNKPHSDIVWRARCEEALPFLGKAVIAAKDDSDRSRFVRSLHFHPQSDARKQFAVSLFTEGGPEVVQLALGELDRESIEQAGGLKRLEELAIAGKGTPVLVELATRFNLQSDEILSALLEFITSHRNNPQGATAARHLLGNPELLERSLASGDLASRKALATALGRAGDKRALDHLAATLSKAKDTVVRKACVEAMAISEQGQHRLLELAKGNGLSDDVKFAVGALLSRSSNQNIRQEITKVLNLPKAPGTDSLPPLTQLLAIKGDAKRGKGGFTKGTCITCHQVKGEGINYGPDLTEIGDKLPKEALFEAILYPSNAVAHGYAGIQLETKTGDTLVGFLSSETDDEVTMQMAGGIARKVKANDIKSRKELEASLMPAGLAGLLHPLELADLVAYLESLKKKK